MADEDSDVRSGATGALGQIGGEAAIPNLLQALADEDRGVRSGASRALILLARNADLPTSQTIARRTLWQLPQEGSDFGELFELAVARLTILQAEVLDTTIETPSPSLSVESLAYWL